MNAIESYSNIDSDRNFLNCLIVSLTKFMWSVKPDWSESIVEIKGSLKRSSITFAIYSDTAGTMPFITFVDVIHFRKFVDNVISPLNRKMTDSHASCILLFASGITESVNFAMMGRSI